jgi:hypothetical protein
LNESGADVHEKNLSEATPLGLIPLAKWDAGGRESATLLLNGMKEAMISKRVTRDAHNAAMMEAIHHSQQMAMLVMEECWEYVSS